MERHGNLCKRFTLFKSVLKLELIPICQNNITSINLAIFMNHFCHFPSYIFIVNMYTCNYGRHVKCYMFFVNILLSQFFHFLKALILMKCTRQVALQCRLEPSRNPSRQWAVASQALSCGQQQRRRSRQTTCTWAQTSASRTPGQPQRRHVGSSCLLRGVIRAPETAVFMMEYLTVRKQAEITNYSKRDQAILLW